jgi:hypothetical protein
MLTNYTKWDKFKAEFPHTLLHEWESAVRAEEIRCNQTSDEAARSLLGHAIVSRDNCRGLLLCHLMDTPTAVSYGHERPVAWALLVGWNQAVRERIRRLTDELHT